MNINKSTKRETVHRSKLLAHGIKRRMAAPVEPPMKKPSTTHGKLLLIEDNKVVLDAVKDFLKYEIKGFTILTTKTLDEAENMLMKERGITLVVTDMSYPGKRGLEATPDSGAKLIRYLKKRYPAIKVIAYSSSGHYLKSAADAGADRIMNKSEPLARLGILIKELTAV